MSAKSKVPTPTLSKAGEYNNIVDAAELLDVKLIKSDFSVHPNFFVGGDHGSDFRYACDLISSHYDQATQRLIGEVALEAGSRSGRRWALRARAVYLVAYSVSGDPAEEAAFAYLERVGRFTAYPYFRSFFAGVCADAGAIVPPLPVLKGNLPRRISGAELPAGELSASLKKVTKQIQD